MLTLRKGAVATEMAGHARNVMMQSDAITHPEAAHARADPNNGSGCFVTKNPRRWHSAILNFFDVSRANPADRDFDEHLIRTDVRDRDNLDAQIIRPAINDGPHGLWKSEHGEILNTEECNEHDFFRNPPKRSVFSVLRIQRTEIKAPIHIRRHAEP
jgi:hypothetical protein